MTNIPFQASKIHLAYTNGYKKRALSDIQGHSRNFES